MLWNNLVRLLVLVTFAETCFCNNIAKIEHVVSGYRTHTESRAMGEAHSANVDAKQTGRIFFDAIGGWLMDSDYFPIEVNVPDTISTIGDGIGSMWNYLSGSVTSIYSGLVGGAEQATAVNTVQSPAKKVKKKQPIAKKKVIKKKTKKKSVKKFLKPKKKPPKKYKKVLKKPKNVKNKQKPKN